MTKVLRIECMELPYTPALSKFCHQAKNLYNRANFLVKSALNNKNIFLNYYELNTLLKQEESYRVLPAHTAQHTLKLLCRNWKGYFRAKKEWKKHPKKFFAQPRPPRYKPRDGESVAIVTNQQAKIRNGWLMLPKKVGFYYKTRLTVSTRLKEVRIIPRNVGYTLEVVYEKLLPESKNRKPTRKGAIDLGSVNLVTFVDNLGNQPIVIKDHGKGIKSIIQYYMKIQTKLRAQYVQQQKKQLKQQHKLIYGQAYHKQKEKYRRKLKNALHKLTKYLIELFVERGLHEVIIGYNPQWKQQVILGKKVTQMFITIPFLKIINQLKYKGEEQGVKVETIPEEYTSKSSFLDNEFPQKRAKYKGKRSPRGLFTSAQGHKINADVNAAYNILVKSDPKAILKRKVNGVGGYVMYPRRVCVDPQGMTHALSIKQAQLCLANMPA
ncbi:MAG: IS200/IS605 family element transposase accessory protein TnpB [Candidatus Heimdallarchaeota archaeon]|nr:IS200/IS605 family element transposase accessory protein TnpB [Candidatus Heimdallarchaeota archaeon]